MVLINGIPILAEIEVVVCDKNYRVQRLLEHHASTDGLRLLVCVEEPTAENVALAQKAGIKLITFAQLKVGIVLVLPTKYGYLR